MNVLITGAAGFIGSNFVRRVNDHGLQGISSIIALDSLTYAGVIENLDGVARSENYTFVHGDIRDAELVSGLLKDVDAVINFAAESHVDRSIAGAADFVQTNIVGVQTLLDACKALNRKIRFVQISTDEVYGSLGAEGLFLETNDKSWVKHSLIPEHNSVDYLLKIDLQTLANQHLDKRPYVH